MDIRAALYAAITGPHGRRLSTEEPVIGARMTPAQQEADLPRAVSRMIAEVEASIGGDPKRRAGKAAEASGIPVTTWRALRRGRKPSGRSLVALMNAQRRARLARGREKWLRGTPAIAILATVRISSDVRYRVLRPSTWPDAPDTAPADRTEGMVDRTLDWWLRRADPRAAEEFMRPIRVHIGHEVELTSVEEIRFFKTEGEAAAWARNKA